MSKYEIVGLMSGTSLDGLDIAHLRFEQRHGKWTFDVLHSSSHAYEDELQSKLKSAPSLTKYELDKLDVEFAEEMGKRVNRFLLEHNINKQNLDAIASHGHTVFHQPEKGFSKQIGCGRTLAKITGIIVINDFRNGDIAVGGQGAPLVPIGDKLLFSDQADAFLNLGGFCNITFKNQNEKWVAFDISPCNLPLNRIAEGLGKRYDDGGQIAKSGRFIEPLLDKLNRLPYYQLPYPKSLGTEWLEAEFNSKIDFNLNAADLAHTITEHIAQQIGQVLITNKLKKVFVTGGGAYNTYLIDRVRKHSETEVLIPSAGIIEFKEALIFAFLGALHLAGQASNVPSATGASKEVTLGVKFNPE